MLSHPHWYPHAQGCELWGMGCKLPQVVAEVLTAQITFYLFFIIIFLSAIIISTQTKVRGWGLLGSGAAFTLLNCAQRRGPTESTDVTSWVTRTQVWMLPHPHWYPRAPCCEIWGMGCKPPQRTLFSPSSHPQNPHIHNPFPEGLPKHTKLTQNSVKITHKNIPHETVTNILTDGDQQQNNNAEFLFIRKHTRCGKTLRVRFKWRCPFEATVILRSRGKFGLQH